jgi:hypothetical protein
MADLSGDSCRIEAGNRCIRTIIAGLTLGPSVADGMLRDVPQMCPERLPFGSPGPGYENVRLIDAVADRLKVTVEYLSATPQ